ncbi:GGDEF domain-containing protein [Fundidesulfovibrio terrae]|uniref:GGDEF domain-containing protein n=1 Tax=Fundidesulfovibrio terrae TaxID=2922866 RepID=UPI001FAFAC9C|nr:GGDEF domain-containing protein [Fundidesulfovibrio terrae]
MFKRLPRGGRKPVLARLARLLSVLLLAALCLSGFASASPAPGLASGQDDKNVLILFPFTQDYPVHAQLVKGFRERLLQSRRTIRISYEYLDLARFTDEEAYLADVARFFQEKYSRLRPDIVVSGGPLRQFFDTYGERMFPGVPVVFPRDENAALEAQPEDDFTASKQSDFMKSVDIIFRARPATKTVYVVLGDSDEERNIRRKMEHVAQSYQGRARFVFTGGLSLARMLETVGGAGADGAVLFMRWLRDARGDSFIPEDVLKSVCQVSTAPVFTVVEPSLGGGAVGGYLFSFELFGRRLAEETLARLDARHEPERLPYPAASEYVFDWRQLERWKISETTLPKGSRIEFREPSAWSLHKWYILGGVAVLFFETALVVGLAVNRSRRRKVELELKRLNASLEEIVASRTRQLQEANEQLELAKSSLEKMNSRLELVSRTDSLTGLYNRRHVEEAAAREHERSLRTGDVFSVVLCDIDFFKQVNDLYGHEAGDLLLRLVAEDLSREVRPYDILSRWGGEEFLLFLPATGQEVASGIAERIRRSIRERAYSYDGRTLRLTATFGVSTVRGGESVTEVIRRADEALYEGKRSGRNRVVAV